MRANKLNDRCHFIAGITPAIIFWEEDKRRITTGNLRTYVECGARARNGRSFGGRSLFTIGLLKHMRGFLSPRVHFDGERTPLEYLLKPLREQIARTFGER
jgi:hypothetical protein